MAAGRADPEVAPLRPREAVPRRVDVEARQRRDEVGVEPGGVHDAGGREPHLLARRGRRRRARSRRRLARQPSARGGRRSSRRSPRRSPGARGRARGRRGCRSTGERTAAAARTCGSSARNRASGTSSSATPFARPPATTSARRASSSGSTARSHLPIRRNGTPCASQNSERLRLPRTQSRALSDPGRVVDPRVDDLAVARARLLPGRGVPLGDDDRESRPGQLGRAREARRAPAPTTTTSASIRRIVAEPSGSCKTSRNR